MQDAFGRPLSTRLARDRATITVCCGPNQGESSSSWREHLLAAFVALKPCARPKRFILLGSVLRFSTCIETLYNHGKGSQTRDAAAPEGQKVMGMLIPKISDYSTYRDFLVALMEGNKPRRFFSHRFLARKLGFPSSYLNDVISGRKSLTLNRAISMAGTLGLDILDTEYLVILVLQESHSEPVRQFFSQYRRQRYVRDRSEYLADPKGRYSDIVVFALQAFAIGKRATEVGRRALEELYTFSGLTPGRINAALDVLRSDGLLEIDRQGIYRGRQNPIVQNENVQRGVEYVHVQYAQNFASYCNYRLGPATMNAFFTRIPRERFVEVRDKLLAMRDWLRHLSFEKAGDEHIDTPVFQFDLNLFPITRPPERESTSRTT